MIWVCRGRCHGDDPNMVTWGHGDPVVSSVEGAHLVGHSYGASDDLAARLRAVFENQSTMGPERRT
jgi:hypothetical protein